ncbi:ras-domain-containing protein, partial [Serendipita vermifera]
TIEDCHHKQLNVDGEALFVEVVEMDGEWGLLDEASVRAPGGWLLLYSITDRSSFESTQIWAKRLLSIYGEEHAPLVILGTKCDLEYERQVLESEGQAFAAKLGTIYIETSAKLDVNVDAAFVRLIKLIKQHENVGPYSILILLRRYTDKKRDVQSLITTKQHRLQRLVHDSGCIII